MVKAVLDLESGSAELVSWWPLVGHLWGEEWDRPVSGPRS